MKYLSLPSCPAPVLTVDEVAIKLVLSWNGRPVSHLGEESLGPVGSSRFIYI